VIQDLCLYVQMQAWLRTTPKERKQTNEELYGGDLPDVDDDFAHLPVFLQEIGTVGDGINGRTPLTFQEIEAWARMTHITLSGFEASSLRLMSAVYAHTVNDTDAKCPVDSELVQDDVNKVNADMWKAIAVGG